MKEIIDYSKDVKGGHTIDVHDYEPIINIDLDEESIIARCSLESSNNQVFREKIRRSGKIYDVKFQNKVVAYKLYHKL